MRSDPDRLSFEIVARDGDARAGILHTPHGPIETPCFVPLATRGSVKGLLADEVAGIGYELVLGNTYHLMLAPGGERIAALGGLHGFMGWDRAIITDSGGFQVFSLAHGSVATRSRGGAGARRWRGRARDRRGGRPLPLLHRRLRAVPLAGALDGDPGPARLRHRARLRRVHAVPRRPRLHRRIDRADASLARSLPRLACRERARRAGRLRDRPGRHPRGPAARSRPTRSRPPESTGSRSAARSARPRSRCARSSGLPSACFPSTPPSICSASVSPTTWSTGWGAASTASTAPSRPGSGATGWRSPRCPSAASATTSASAATRASPARSSPAAPAPPAPGTAAPTSTTCRRPRS